MMTTREIYERLYAAPLPEGKTRRTAAEPSRREEDFVLSLRAEETYTRIFSDIIQNN